jgi:hypothetical protein
VAIQKTNECPSIFNNKQENPKVFVSGTGNFVRLFMISGDLLEYVICYIKILRNIFRLKYCYNFVRMLCVHMEYRYDFICEYVMFVPRVLPRFAFARDPRLVGKQPPRVGGLCSRKVQRLGALSRSGPCGDGTMFSD